MTSLGMAVSAQQEGFGNAFLAAVAAVAGCAMSRPHPDHDSIDWTLSCVLYRRPKIDLQIKTWTGDDLASDQIRYPLKRKNYDDLIVADVLAPRILVLVTIPKDGEWMKLSASQLVLYRCVYWVSLAGRPASENDTSVTVSVPRSNLLTAQALQEMMQKINDRGFL